MAGGLTSTSYPHLACRGGKPGRRTVKLTCSANLLVAGSVPSQGVIKKIMKIKPKWKRPGLVHVIANCQDCNFEASDFITAVQRAREHARKTGHEVSVETTYAQLYNAK